MAAYNAACVQVAQAFTEISAEVNAAGVSLRSAGRTDLFDAVRTLQQHATEQLRLVRVPRQRTRDAAPLTSLLCAQEATLQVLRKEHAAQKWSWQRGGDAPAPNSLEGVAPRDVRPAWATNCRAHPSDASAADDGGGAALTGCQCAGAEPTEEEYAGAVAEATQALQAAVTGINDALDELREAAADLRAA